MVSFSTRIELSFHHLFVRIANWPSMQRIRVHLLWYPEQKHQSSGQASLGCHRLHLLVNISQSLLPLHQGHHRSLLWWLPMCLLRQCHHHSLPVQRPQHSHPSNQMFLRSSYNVLPELGDPQNGKPLMISSYISNQSLPYYAIDLGGR